MKLNKIACIFNFPSHYRAPIYTLMDSELNCDFYFADKACTPNLKKINYKTLNNFKKELKTSFFLGGFSWMNGAVSLLFKPYKSYFLIGEPFCISTWLIIFFAKLNNKKVYLWSHGWYGKEGRLKSIIKKLFFGQADKVFLYGNYAKGLMIENGFEKDKLKVIYNSLDYQLQLNFRNSLSKTEVYHNYFNNDYPVLIYIGRVQNVKRLDLLINAMSTLKDRNYNMNLLILGGNHEDVNLLRLIEEKDLREHVWRYGPCYEEAKISEFIYNANVCVSPGNVGLTAIHALTYGTPVVTHNNFKNQMPEFESIKEDVTGSFFAENNVEDLANSILKFTYISELEREKIRSNAYSVIDNYYNPINQIEIFKKELE
jgi:glycosyltransferase involved in cell wall biosynthesis